MRARSPFLTVVALGASLHGAQAQDTVPAFSEQARTLGQQVFDTCNPVITAPVEARITESFQTDTKTCMTLAYTETKDYAERFIAEFAKSRSFGFEYGLAESKLGEHCTLQFRSDTTDIQGSADSVAHNTDVTNDCLYYIFEANARFPNPVFDMGVHYTLQTATLCLGDMVSKWPGSCKEINGSPNMPVPFRRAPN